MAETRWMLVAGSGADRLPVKIVETKIGLDPREARRRAGGWYKQRRWKQLRANQLRKAPRCECPHHRGREDAPLAEVVDHIVPHRGDFKLFVDPANLQSMAKFCHDKFKQSQEKGGAGFLAGCDEIGQPLDQSHPWHEQRKGIGGSMLFDSNGAPLSSSHRHWQK